MTCSAEKVDDIIKEYAEKGIVLVKGNPAYSISSNGQPLVGLYRIETKDSSISHRKFI